MEHGEHEAEASGPASQPGLIPSVEEKPGQERVFKEWDSIATLFSFFFCQIVTALCYLIVGGV